MSGQLKKGDRIHTFYGQSIIVDKLLSEGGQGYVYAVFCNNEKKALKWYKKESLGNNPKAFYDNLHNNIDRKAPSAEFLWPLDITEWKDGTFGYVMDLKPAGYYEVTEFILGHVHFQSFKTVVDASMHIVSAFRILHNAGYSYQDINDGNFFINPNTGHVLIADNDNIAPDGTETGILGKPRYMAPEIVMQISKPNSLSDRFSMSVILYRLFCLDHPLEGKRYLVPAFTEEIQKKLYGSEPLFVMDPDDKRNRPDPSVQGNSSTIWKQLPDYMKDIFIAAFSQKALHKPSARPKEIEWLKVLTRFRNDIVTCECGNEIFIKPGKACRCEICGKKKVIPYRLVLRDYEIPASKGSRIYRCQLGVCDESDALKPVAQIVAKRDTGALGIRNESAKRWDAVTTKGTARKVAPGEVIPLKDGITFHTYDETVLIKE